MNKNNNANKCKNRMLIAILLLTLVSYSKDADAQAPSCDAGDSTAVINLAYSAIPAIDMKSIIQAGLDTVINTTYKKTTIEYFFNSYLTAFNNKLSWLSERVVKDGLKPFAGQLTASQVMSSLQDGKYKDTQNIQKRKADVDASTKASYLKYEPSNQDYRFDSKARYFKAAEQLTRTVGSSYSQMFTSIASNKTGTEAKDGSISFSKERWDSYQKFCDPLDSNGHAGCTKTSRDDKSGLATTLSKTLYGSYTFDFTNKGYMFEALRELSYNLTGYDTTSSIVASAAMSSAGQTKMIKSRSYLAQMDVAGSMLYSAIATRFPTPSELSDGGDNAIQSIREKEAGVTNASATPSLYEIRKATIEELWSPNYYLDLVQNSYSLERKEIYLQAYGLMALNDMIEKQERISEAYSIETAGMISQTAESQHKTGTSNINSTNGSN